jgi:hypothetical protein
MGRPRCWDPIRSLNSSCRSNMLWFTAAVLRSMEMLRRSKSLGVSVGLGFGVCNTVAVQNWAVGCRRGAYVVVVALCCETARMLY